MRSLLVKGSGRVIRSPGSTALVGSLKSNRNDYSHLSGTNIKNGRIRNIGTVGGGLSLRRNGLGARIRTSRIAGRRTPRGPLAIRRRTRIVRVTRMGCHRLMFVCLPGCPCERV